MNNIDPERSITITLPYGLIDQLTKIKPTLSMFRDDNDIRAAIEIIDAIHVGALEFLRQEDGEVMEYLTDIDNSEIFLPPENKDEKDEENGDT